MMPAKLHYSGLLKIKIFQDNGHDVIIPDYGHQQNLIT